MVIDAFTISGFIAAAAIIAIVITVAIRTMSDSGDGDTNR